MVQTVGRNIAAPLLFLNLIMYLIVVGFASWCLNRFINGHTNHPGNGATMFFLTSALMAGVVGVVSKCLSGSHIGVWRNDSLAAAESTSIIAWALTAIAFGLSCKERSTGGYRGWRLKVMEAFVIILTFTHLLYLALIHAGLYSSKYKTGYRDNDYGVGAGGVDPAGQKGTGVAMTGTRV